MHLRQVKNKKTGRTYLSIVQSYRGADGKVAASGSNRVGLALTAASADGETVEIALN